MRRYMSGFKVLFSRLHNAHPEIADGSMTVIFNIDPAGVVHDAAILRSDFSDFPEFESEIIVRMGRVKFAPVDGKSDTTVEYLLSFNP